MACSFRADGSYWASARTRTADDRMGAQQCGGPHRCQTRNSDVGVEAESGEIGFHKQAPPTDRRCCITGAMAVMRMEIDRLALTDIQHVNHVRGQSLHG